jgi:hypothetical protein
MHFSLYLLFLSLLGELLSVCLSPLRVPLARRKIFIFLVFLAPFLSHSLASPRPSKCLLNAFSFSTPPSFLLAVSLPETVCYSVWRYKYNRLSYVIYSDLFCLV